MKLDTLKHAMFTLLLCHFATTLGCVNSTLSQARKHRLAHKNIAQQSWEQAKAFSTPMNFARIDYPTLQAAIFYATNDTRQKHGLKTVRRHVLLERAAQLHAIQMVQDNFFAHQNPHDARFRTPNDRAKAVGIKNPLIAENIAVSIGIDYTSGELVYPLQKKGKFSRTAYGKAIPNYTYAEFAKSVLVQWMNSPGHRANILSTKAIELGGGAYFFWQDGFPAFKTVQNFQFYNPAQPASAQVAAKVLPHHSTPRSTQHTHAYSFD